MGYLRPENLKDALAGLEAGASVIAGGTDWFPARGDRAYVPSLLDVTSIDGFKAISHGPSGWRLGAAVTWSDVIGADLPTAFDALKAAGREVGSVQVQNTGTLVGNLCNASPAADGVPPLLTLDAAVECTSRTGARTVPLSHFIKGPRQTDLRPDELVTAIVGPPVSAEDISMFSKLGARRYLVISIAMVALQARIENGAMNDVRLAVGSCGPVARRLRQLEAKLEGCRHLPKVTPADLVELSPIDDLRASADYRLESVAEVVARMTKEVLHG